MFFWWKKRKKKTKRKSKKYIDLEVNQMIAMEKAVIEELKKREVKTAPAKVTPAIGVAAHTTEKLKLVPSNCQHIGARKRQEDSFGFTDLGDGRLVKDSGVLAVVADGMGGLAKGDLASQVAVSIFLGEYRKRTEQDPLDQFLQRTIHRSNCAVFDLAYDGGVESELGTTLVAVAIHQGKMHWVSVGDSRIYHYKNEALIQLNEEHVYANRLKDDVKNGLITQKEANEHPERSYLTSFLGLPELNEIDYSIEPVTLEPGEVVLLCSDGLTNTINDHEIVEIIEQEPANLAEELTQKALAKNKRYQDNVTVVAISCQPVKPEINEKKQKENNDE
jgi:PPM family protein phosphatase